MTESNQGWGMEKQEASHTDWIVMWILQFVNIGGTNNLLTNNRGQESLQS